MKLRANLNRFNLQDIPFDMTSFFAGQVGMDIVDRFAPDTKDHEKMVKLLNKFSKYVKFTRYTIAFQRGEFTQEYLESMPIYSMTKNEYFKKGIKSKYFGSKGAAEEFIRQLGITEDELDNRLINTFIGMTMFLGYIFGYLYSTDGPVIGHLKDTTLALANYANKNCKKELFDSSPWHIFYFYDSFLYNLVKSLAFPVIMRNSESSVENNVVIVQELLSILFTIMLNNPEDCLWLTGLGYYYIQQCFLSMNVQYSLCSLDLFALTTPKSVRDAYPEFDDAHDFKSFVKAYESDGKKACALQMGAVVSNEELKKIPKIYKTVWQRNTSIPDFIDRLTPFIAYSTCDVYQVYKDRSAIRRSIYAVHELLSEAEDLEQWTVKTFNAKYSELANRMRAEDSRLFMPAAVSEHDFNNYRSWVYNSDLVRECFRYISSISGVILAGQSRVYHNELLTTKLKLAAQEDAVTKLAHADATIAQYKKNYERSQQKLNESREKALRLSDENTKLKREAESYISSNKAAAKIEALQKQLDVERTINVKLRNRVKTLEDGDRNVDVLIAKIAELEKSVAAERHLAELVMSEPAEDTRELTPMELTQLRTIRAHLVVPDMNSFKELSRLMPNSVFTYNPNDRNIRLRISKGCDIFFFCTKFCCHGDWWNWSKQLSNVPERCIYAHTAGKNNVARLILDKARELGLIKDDVSSQGLASALQAILK